MVFKGTTRQTHLQPKLMAALKTFRRSTGIPSSEDLVLAAVSGGPDSTALLDLLLSFSAEIGFMLCAGHFNHHLRTEADAEADAVGILCNKLGVPLESGGADIPNIMAAQGGSLHNAARRERYRFLATAAHRFREQFRGSGRAVVMTAHHRDDQFETVLMRLFEGTGVEGLSGIRRVELWRDDWGETILARPLLAVRGEELKSWCHQRGLEYQTDTSNLDPHWPRNRIRKFISPIVESHFGTAAVAATARLAEIMASAAEVIQQHIDLALKDTLIWNGEGEWRLDYAQYKSYLEVIRLGCLKAARQNLSESPERISMERLVNADEFIRRGAQGCVELGSGVMVSREGQKIYIYTPVLSDWRIKPSVGAVTTVPGWGELEITRLKASSVTPRRLRESNLICISADDIRGDDLEIRPAEPGDRMITYGSDCRQRVTDLLRIAGVPRHRRRWPLLCWKKHIAALPPWRIADRFKVTPQTNEIFVIHTIGASWNY